MNRNLHRPAGSTARDGYATRIDPESAGWDHCSLRVVELAPGEQHEFATGDSEWIVLPLSGACSVRCDGRTFDLDGRTGVFDGVTDFAYVPRDAEVRVVGHRWSEATHEVKTLLTHNHVPYRWLEVDGDGVVVNYPGVAVRK